MNIGAVSQGIMEVAAASNPIPESTGDGSFFQNVEKALSTINTVSLNDEQEALDLGEFSGAVASLIMSFYANGGNVIELQDAQTMADTILGSDAMLDLLSYNEVTLNDIFLSNLNGGVLNGSGNLEDKIANMDFSSLIDAISKELSVDFDLGKDMNQLISQIMKEIQTGMEQNVENSKLGEANTLFDVVGKIRVDSEPQERNNEVAEATNNNETVNQETVIKTGQEDRINTEKKSDYKNEVKDSGAEVKMTGEVGNVVTNFEKAEITLERPIESADLAGSVLELMETSVANGKDSLFIKLKPDFLGGIAIKLAMSEDGVVAKIVTSNERTQSMLAAQLSTLETNLKEKGIDVARMEVLYNPLNQDGQRQNDGGQGRSGGNSSNRRFAIDEIDDDSHLQYLQLMGEEEELEEGVYNA